MLLPTCVARVDPDSVITHCFLGDEHPHQPSRLNPVTLTPNLNFSKALSESLFSDGESFFGQKLITSEVEADRF
jgi:hypothetical protein